MGYFDDIQFIDAAVDPHCRAVIDHRFTGTYSLEFLLAGRMFFGIDRGPQVVLDRPAAFWHHPGHVYQYGAVDEQGWHHHWVLIKGARARRLVADGLMPLAPAGYLHVQQPAVFADLFVALVELVRDGDLQRQGDRVILLERLVCLLHKDVRAAAGATPHRARLEAVACSLADAPCQTYDFRQIARTLHLSYSQFRRLFRRCVGHAPYEYLLLSRMRLAARALQDPERQVKEVAARCGYEDPAQFCKLFKKKIGMSPQQYRNALPRA